VSAGVAKTLQLKKISLIVGFTYRGLTVIHFFEAFFMANPNLLSEFIKNLFIKKYSWFDEFDF